MATLGSIRSVFAADKSDVSCGAIEPQPGKVGARFTTTFGLSQGVKVTATESSTEAAGLLKAWRRSPKRSFPSQPLRQQVGKMAGHVMKAVE
jgi:hypothetical protein